ncbi:hypothetical protein [Novosphingobium sp.]|uniref:hypothetical protein n=1 Tax=Novosphingobium sp. TaxID=1874826 RepID=UPI00286DEA94|nr:hypothetical protein [Novosphingobium sp.]
MAQAGPPLAVKLPFNQATMAQRQLLTGDSKLTKAQRDDLAVLAIRRAPLSAQPLAYLALVAEQQGKEARTQFLLEAARPLGWHDGAVQRILYDRAASDNNQTDALRRAEALLRQGLAFEDLTADFARKSGDARFRAALVAMLSKQGAWADRWAGLEGPHLDDVTLTELSASPQFRQVRSRESLTIFAAQLAQTGRTRIAWRLAHGPQAGGPLRLDWQPEADFPASAVFSWQLPASYPVVDTAGGQQIKRQDAAPAEPARLRMGLAPGRYRISFPDIKAGAATGWRVGFTCSTRDAPALIPVNSSVDLAIAQSCEQQVLFIVSDPGTPSALPAPVLQRLGD